MPDAPVELHEPNPLWAQQFVHEQRVLAEALAEWLLGPPEHIGSTAIPGLAAKPVIDIMAPVASLAASAAAIAAVKRLGYVHFPYQPELMHWFCKPSPAHRTHHLHLVPWGSPLWRDRLAFREALRGSSALCDEYLALKRQLAAMHRDDREAYTEGKSAFVAGVLARGRA